MSRADKALADIRSEMYLPAHKHPDDGQCVGCDLLARLTGKTFGLATDNATLENRWKCADCRAAFIHFPDCKWTSGASEHPIWEELADALNAAMARHTSMHSPHEGHSVIREELDELWEHVRADTGRSADARKEAIQIAAMGLRYALDLCDDGTTA